MCGFSHQSQTDLAHLYYQLGNATSNSIKREIQELIDEIHTTFHQGEHGPIDGEMRRLDLRDSPGARQCDDNSVMGMSGYTANTSRLEKISPLDNLMADLQSSDPQVTRWKEVLNLKDALGEDGRFMLYAISSRAKSADGYMNELCGERAALRDGASI